jgi:hypothetical protein
VRQGPCEPWPLDPQCLYGLPADPADYTPAQLAAVTAASELLWRWTAGVYDTCTRVVRPCRADCQPGWPTPVLEAGRWLNMLCGCGGAPPCYCGAASTVQLPGPVASVSEVLQDGLALPPDAYRVDSWALLVRLDGQSWPACQDMGKATTQPGTWQVTYRQGSDVPAGGRRAAGALAAELLRSCTGGGCTRLPANTTSVTREGVSVLIDTSGLATAWRTGLPEVDLWVYAVNPNRVQQRSAVHSVDVPGAVTTTWPAPAGTITRPAMGPPVTPLSPDELAAADQAVTTT